MDAKMRLFLGITVTASAGAFFVAYSNLADFEGDADLKLKVGVIGYLLLVTAVVTAVAAVWVRRSVGAGEDVSHESREN